VRWDARRGSIPGVLPRRSSRKRTSSRPGSRRVVAMVRRCARHCASRGFPRISFGYPSWEERLRAVDSFARRGSRPCGSSCRKGLVCMASSSTDGSTSGSIPSAPPRRPARYLSDLHRRFGGVGSSPSPPTTWATAALLSAIRKYNTNDYWELCSIRVLAFPTKTALYVPKIVAMAVGRQEFLDLRPSMRCASTAPGRGRPGLRSPRGLPSRRSPRRHA